MKKNNCEMVRRELDELMIGEECSSAAAEHLRNCAPCREFYEQQTKLRQIVGSLGTIEAPADFDFRLRARLAQRNGSSIHWRWVSRGLAAVAVVLLLITAGALVRNLMKQPAHVDYTAQQPEVSQPVEPARITPKADDENQPLPVVVRNIEEAPSRIQKGDRRRFEYNKQPLATRESTSIRAEVVNGATPVGVSAAFPIDASNQTFKVSLDDGRGNAKTISVPTISFGSQRIVQSGNQVAPKRVW